MEREYYTKIFWLLAVLIVYTNGCSSGNSILREKYDVCFAKDYPGATSRVAAYTPVRCSNETIKLGEAIDAEYADLEFKDVDGDVEPEVIIVSSEFWCRWSGSGCAGPRRITVKVSGDRDAPIFTILSVEKLEPSGQFKDESGF